jgi:hypothetical protein
LNWLRLLLRHPDSDKFTHSPSLPEAYAATRTSISGNGVRCHRTITLRRRFT